MSICTSSNGEEACEVLIEKGSACCLAKGHILQLEIVSLQRGESDLMCLSVEYDECPSLECHNKVFSLLLAEQTVGFGDEDWSG